MDPRSAPGDPGAAQEAPRRPQEPPGAPQERPRGAKKRIKKGSCFRFGLPKASGSPPGGILEQFWSDFRSPGKLFGANFGPIFETISLAFSRPRSSKCWLLSPSLCNVFLEISGASACMFFKALQSSGRKARRETARKQAKRAPLQTAGERA